jgi:hypothetical protein
MVLNNICKTFMLLCYYVIMLLCYYVIMLLCYYVIMLLCYYVINNCMSNFLLSKKLNKHTNLYIK